MFHLAAKGLRKCRPAAYGIPVAAFYYGTRAEKESKDLTTNTSSSLPPPPPTPTQPAPTSLLPPPPPVQPATPTTNVTPPARFDSKMKSYYGMHEMELKNLVHVSHDGLWRFRANVQSNYSPKPVILELISIDSGKDKCGIAIWDETKKQTKGIGSVKTEKMKVTLQRMIREHILDSEDIQKMTKEIVQSEGKDDRSNKKIFGLVIGLPCSYEGETEGCNHEHVKQLIEKLDSDDAFHGVPFCFVNEYGSTGKAATICKQKRAQWNMAKESGPMPVDDVFRFQVCKDTEAARIIMMTFIEKVGAGSSEVLKGDSADPQS